MEGHCHNDVDGVGIQQKWLHHNGLYWKWWNVGCSLWNMMSRLGYILPPFWSTTARGKKGHIQSSIALWEDWNVLHFAVLALNFSVISVELEGSVMSQCNSFETWLTHCRPAQARWFTSSPLLSRLDQTLCHTVGRPKLGDLPCLHCPLALTRLSAMIVDSQW